MSGTQLSAEPPSPWTSTVVTGHDDAPALVVLEAEDPTVSDGGTHRGLDVLGSLVRLEHDLACGLLNADLDLHGSSFVPRLTRKPHQGVGG